MPKHTSRDLSGQNWLVKDIPVNHLLESVGLKIQLGCISLSVASITDFGVPKPLPDFPDLLNSESAVLLILAAEEGLENGLRVAAVAASLDGWADKVSDLLGHLPDLAQQKQNIVRGISPQSVHLATLPERQVHTCNELECLS